MGRPSLADYAQLALLALLWGSSFNLTRIAVGALPPSWIVAGRVGIAALLLFALLEERRALYSSMRTLWPRYMLQACLLGTVPWGLIAWASRHIDSGATAILGSTTPVFAFLLTWGLTRHEPATPRKLLGALLGCAGVATMLGTSSLRADATSLAAQLACLLASVLYAVAAIHGRQFDRVPPLTCACATMAMATAMSVPFALVVDGVPPRPPVNVLFALAALGALSTGLALVLYYRLLASIGSVSTTSNNYLRIAVGVLIGVLVLDEALTLDKLLGLLLVGAGVFAMVSPGRSASVTTRPV